MTTFFSPCARRPASMAAIVSSRPRSTASTSSFGRNSMSTPATLNPPLPPPRPRRGNPRARRPPRRGRVVNQLRAGGPLDCEADLLDPRGGSRAHRLGAAEELARLGMDPGAGQDDVTRLLQDGLARVD